MNYQKIYSFDLANGEGVRTSIFVSGCTLHCKGCFNTEAWCFESGKPLTSIEFFQISQLLKNPYYSGLSILGGEPFDQTDNYLLIELCKVAHANNKNVWIWSGHDFEELNLNMKNRELLENCDVLIDGRFEEDKKDLSLKWRGSSNQRIIDVQKSLIGEKIIEYEG